AWRGRAGLKTQTIKVAVVQHACRRRMAEAVGMQRGNQRAQPFREAPTGGSLRTGVKGPWPLIDRKGHGAGSLGRRTAWAVYPPAGVAECGNSRVLAAGWT